MFISQQQTADQLMDNNYQNMFVYKLVSAFKNTDHFIYIVLEDHIVFK